MFISLLLEIVLLAIVFAVVRYILVQVGADGIFLTALNIVAALILLFLILGAFGFIGASVPVYRI